jgi:F0F1-type ATP synthase assembly protein I
MKNASDTSSLPLGAQIMIASELGSVFALAVVLGYFGGNWLDGLLKCGPYGVIGGLMVGMGLGLAIVVKRANQLDKGSSGAAAPSSSTSSDSDLDSKS